MTLRNWDNYNKREYKGENPICLRLVILNKLCSTLMYSCTSSLRISSDVKSFELLFPLFFSFSTLACFHLAKGFSNLNVLGYFEKEKYLAKQTFRSWNAKGFRNLHSHMSRDGSQIRSKLPQLKLMITWYQTMHSVSSRWQAFNYPSAFDMWTCQKTYSEYMLSLSIFNYINLYILS